MAFDGSAYDKLLAQPGSRLLRPAPREYALSVFPRFIFLLKKDLLQLSFARDAQGPQSVSAFRPGHVEDRWNMLEEDFLKCKKVAEEVTVPLFVTEPESAYLGRIRAHLAVEYP